jgi:hypothetical protein
VGSGPEFLNAIRGNATPISIREGETKTIELKIKTAS